MSLTSPQGPYSPEELTSILDTQSAENRKGHYWKTIERYKAFVAYMNDASKQKHLSPSAFVDLDTKRRALHRQLEQIAHAIGMSSKEIFTDLLRGNGHLGDRGLEEFTLVDRNDIQLMNGYFPDEIGDDGGESGEEWEQIESLGGHTAQRVVTRLRKGELGILFVRRIFATIPDLRELVRGVKAKSYTRFMGPKVSLECRGERERIRRAIRLSEDLGVPLLHTSMFSHNVSDDILAIVVDKESIDLVVATIRNHRDEYGIRSEDLPADIVEKDWNIYREEMRQIFKGREWGVYEHFWREMNEKGYKKDDREFLEDMGVDLSKKEKSVPKTEQGLWSGSRDIGKRK